MSSNLNTILFILPASSVTITFEVVFLSASKKSSFELRPIFKSVTLAFLYCLLRQSHPLQVCVNLLNIFLYQIPSFGLKWRNFFQNKLFEFD